ncbi:MAG: hypothetical protein JSR18_15120 [Proteobacteria bacterium]|nr:hypothetical protein [Pseudomonadota bacterium]
MSDPGRSADAATGAHAAKGWRVPTLPLDLVNRALARDPALLAELGTHAGRAFRVESGPLTLTLTPTAGGALAFAAPDTHADVTLRVAPLDVPRLLQDPAGAETLVTADGDAAFAATLRRVVHTLPWHIEAQLADVLGPVAGQRVADFGRAALGWPADAAARWHASVGRWLRDETNTVVGRGEGAAFAAAVAALAADAEALAARITALAARR